MRPFEFGTGEDETRSEIRKVGTKLRRRRSRRTIDLKEGLVEEVDARVACDNIAQGERHVRLIRAPDIAQRQVKKGCVAIHHTQLGL